MSKLSIEEFARRVRLSSRTIHRYIKDGQVVPRRSLGGRVYFYVQDVEVFLNHTSSEPLVFDGVPTNDSK